jgi:hypothetical protein
MASPVDGRCPVPTHKSGECLGQSGPDSRESASFPALTYADQLAVVHRVDDRPPEEASSDDPMAQAQTILEDSEERTAEGAAGSEPTSR